MNANVEKLIERMAELEGELAAEFEKEMAAARARFRYTVERERAVFERSMCDFHERFRKSVPAFLIDAGLPSLLVAPVIYSLAVPLVLLDAWVWLYQAVCFRVYGIEKVKRSDFLIFDRGRLPYLNAIERLNCDYCSYANGLIAYVREVASRSEQYFCPIKHAQRRLAAHERYPSFFEFGDAEAYRKEYLKLREELREPPPGGEKKG